MENAKKAYAYQAIQDVLELIDRVNGMIDLHKTQNTPDILTIAGYELQREQFLAELAELLSQFGVEIVRPLEPG
jgi:molecular chaperone GrpE (heat shock protein)